MSGVRMLCSDALHWACSVVMRYTGYSALRIGATACGEVTHTSLQRTIIQVLEKSRLPILGIPHCPNLLLPFRIKGFRIANGCSCLQLCSIETRDVFLNSGLPLGRLILFSGAVPDQCDSKAI